MEHVQCLIIGSGPAGYTAAIYAARAGLNPLLYTGIATGGQLMLTTEVDNFPGYPNGVKGPAMMDDLQKQAERFGTEIRYGHVSSVDFSSRPHQVIIDDTTVISADSVIISTGASAKWLGLPSEQKYNGSGVSACAICDGFFYRGQDVALCGGGDTAAEEALYLAKLCRKVYMIIRKGEFAASKAMADRVLATSNIEVLFHNEVTEVLGDGLVVTGVQLINNRTNKDRELAVTGLFVAIGHNPNTSIFKKWLELDKAGYVLTKGKSTETNVPGIFCCGDAQDPYYRQAVTAAGSGCMAALDAERYLAVPGSEAMSTADQLENTAIN